MMAAMAIDQDATQAHIPHLAERDLDRAAVGMRWRVAADRARHACIGARRGPESNRQSLGSGSGTSTLSVGDVENTARARACIRWFPISRISLAPSGKTVVHRVLPIE